MTEREQIEMLAKDLCRLSCTCEECQNVATKNKDKCKAKVYAERAYRAGYRKIPTTDWLTKGVPQEQLEREKQEATMSIDLGLCHTEFATGVGEIYTDYDTTAQKMIAKGYRKQSEGEWDTITDYGTAKSVECTACKKAFWFMKKGQLNIDRMPFCPNCGARMTGVNKT